MKMSLCKQNNAHPHKGAYILVIETCDCVIVWQMKG
jgi:hypothetical protein